MRKGIPKMTQPKHRPERQEFTIHVGAAAAQAFAGQGANVALLSRSEDAIAILAGEIGPKALAIPCDVGRFWEVQAAVDATVAAFGGVDVLINNAGVIEPVARA